MSETEAQPREIRDTINPVTCSDRKKEAPDLTMARSVFVPICNCERHR